MEFINMIQEFWQLVIKIQEFINGESNEGIFLALIITIIALMYSYYISRRDLKDMIEEKEVRIKELVNERNKYQEIVFDFFNIERQSTKKN